MSERRRERDRAWYLRTAAEHQQILAAEAQAELNAAALERARTTPRPGPEPTGVEAGGYPFTAGSYLHASDLNAALEGNPAAAPPAAMPYKLWWDTAPAAPQQTWWDGVEAVVAGALDPLTHLWLPLVGGGIASAANAATIDLGQYPQTLITITGTGSISSFGSTLQQGSGKLLTFQDGATVVAAPPAMILVGTAGANIVAQPGDMAFAWALGGGGWRVIWLPVAPASAGGITDAPATSFAYGRHSNNWTPVLMLSNDILDGGNF